MKPVKSNIAKTGCSPTSTDCVIWDGPCLDALGIKPGDQLTKAFYDLATHVCKLMELTDLSNLDLTCLVETCAGCPQPSKTLSIVLDLLIKKVCKLQDLISTDPENPTNNEELLVRIASCFQYEDENGDIITDIKVSKYVEMIGNMVCELRNNVISNTQILTQHGVRIAELEKLRNEGLGITTAVSSCLNGGNQIVLKQVDEFLQELEQQFCILRNSVGDSSNVLQGISKQCTSLNTSPSLSGDGSMMNISGWKTNVVTVGDAINNLWITVCDLRAAVMQIKDITAPSCGTIIVNFTSSYQNGGETLVLKFSEMSSIPMGFYDCGDEGSILSITDADGKTYSGFINVSNLVSTGNSLNISLSSSGLNYLTGSLDIKVSYCLSNGTIVCNNEIAKTIPVMDTCGAPTNLVVSMS